MHQRKSGRDTYEDSDEETVVRLLGDITDVTEAISRTDISGTSGCGVFDSDTGNAPFYSWREYLAEVFERDWDGGKQELC